MKNYKVLSFNLRINAPVDGLNSWDYRKQKVMTYLGAHDFDIIGLQEAGPTMYQELKTHMSDYDLFGHGRGMDHEAVPILVKKGKYQILESKTLWLSETPLVESRVIGSLFPRIVTYVVIRDNEQKIISFFNTHLDYISDEVCTNQAKILSQIIDQVTHQYQCPFILVGDFNQNPDSQTIRYLSSKYQNIYHEEDRISLTFHNFTNNTKGLPIDYFFYSHQLIDDSFEIVHHQESNFFLSDHYPLIAKFSIKA